MDARAIIGRNSPYNPQARIGREGAHRGFPVCPTCNAVLTCLATAPWVCVHFCERCGTTTVTDSKGHATVHRPALVDRCRKFARGLGRILGGAWKTHGIAESIGTEERSKA